MMWREIAVNKRVFCFLITFIILAFVGCSCKSYPSSGESSASTPMDAYLEEEKKATKAFLKTSTKKAYSKVIKTTYSEEIIFSKMKPNYLKDVGASFSFLPDIHDFEVYEFPSIECLRRVDDNHYYALYQTSEGGLLYVFFDSNYHYSHTAYMKKSLSYSDFSGIRIGSSAEEVNRIDPAVNSILQYGISNNDGEYISSFHILKDGLLGIIFEKEENGETYKVKDMGLIEDFKYELKFEGSSDTWVMDFRILPQDYIG